MPNSQASAAFLSPLVQLAALAWLSHAAAVARPPIQLANDLVHLVGSAIWPGGLIPLFLLLKPSVTEPIKRTTLVRFSNYSMMRAAIIGCTGVINACFRFHHVIELV